MSAVVAYVQSGKGWNAVDGPRVGKTGWTGLGLVRLVGLVLLVYLVRLFMLVMLGWSICSG